jgi:hypothetical protein
MVGSSAEQGDKGVIVLRKENDTLLADDRKRGRKS